MDDKDFIESLKEICTVETYVPGEDWMQKVLQLKQVLDMRHDVMLVGPSCSGKSSAISTLLKGLEKLDKVRGIMHIIDPKIIDKESLCGVLDGTTMDWTDGVFTNILCTILNNQRDEADQRHWIIFDGDVDPEWAENLNIVLDDNKLLTLPSGEMLNIPDNLRIILEVDSLEQATPASVSRCGMVWFSKDVVTDDMCLQQMMNSLKKLNVLGDDASENVLPAQNSFLDAIEPLVLSPSEEDSISRRPSFVETALEFSLSQTHIMPPTREKLVSTL